MGLVDSIQKWHFRCEWYTYLFIVLYTILSFSVPYMITRIFDPSITFTINSHPLNQDLTNPVNGIIFFLLIIFIGGPCGEQFGWRGYLLPRLEEKLTPVTAGILVGIVWAFWHFPMYLFHVEGYQNSFLLYLAQTILLSMICTWVYHKSNQSIGIVILFHTIDDFVNCFAHQAMCEQAGLYAGIYWGMQIILLIMISVDLMVNHSKIKVRNLSGSIV